MNDLIAFLLIAIKVFLESRILVVVLFSVLILSVFLYYFWRGMNFSDSFTAGLMAIFLVTGLIIFYVGAVFATDANSFIASNSTSTQSQSSSDFIAIGWGLIGFGVAIISIGFSYFGNIESQRSIAMIKVLLFRGRRYTRNFHESLNSGQLFVISLIWLFGALIILISNLTISPSFIIENSWLIIIPTIIGWIMGIIGFICAGFALHRNCIMRQELIRKIKSCFHWIRIQIIIHCIFCYLFTDRFPEIFEE